jgi:cytochrome c-type biogenesis protein CcsB
METLALFTTLAYLLSTVGYSAFLFQQKKVLNRIGFILLLAGFILNSILIGYKYALAGQFPAYDLQGTLVVAAWAVAGVFFLLQYKFHLKILGLFAALLAAVIMIAASQVASQPLPARNLFNNFWLISHVIAVFIGNASFALACGAGLLYLLQERAIKSKRPGFFFKRLPALERIDGTGYACIIIGFSMLTLGLITGFVYAKSVWGRFWDWDPKEIWAGITWLLYAALLHGRVSLGWRGRKAAIMSIIGFAVLLFTFFGVNFLLQGHHGQFTRF